MVSISILPNYQLDGAFQELPDFAVSPFWNLNDIRAEQKAKRFCKVPLKKARNFALFAKVSCALSYSTFAPACLLVTSHTERGREKGHPSLEKGAITFRRWPRNYGAPNKVSHHSVLNVSRAEHHDTFFAFAISHFGTRTRKQTRRDFCNLSSVLALETLY